MIPRKIIRERVQKSFGGNVFLGEVSFGGNVFLGEVSFGGNVFWVKCLLGETDLGEMSQCQLVDI